MHADWTETAEIRISEFIKRAKDSKNSALSFSIFEGSPYEETETPFRAGRFATDAFDSAEEETIEEEIAVGFLFIRRRLYIYLFGTAGVLILLFILGIFFGPVHKECTNDVYPYYEHCTRYSLSIYLLRDGAGWLIANNWVFSLIATAAIGFYTWRLWVSTNKLWTASERQLNHARIASGIELRAYVGIDEDTRPHIRQGEIEGDHVVFVAEIKNYGKTPAYDVDIRINAKAFPEPLDPGFVFPEPEKKGSNTHNLNPGQASWMRLRPLKNHLPDIAAGKSNFYVFGYVSYWDVFRKTRRHTYIRIKIQMPKEEGAGAKWFFCGDGNKAT